MFTKTLIAAIVAFGALAASAMEVSAHSASSLAIERHDNIFNQAWKTPGFRMDEGSFFFDFGSKKDCSPVYAETWDWHPWKGWVLKTVKVGENCDWKPFTFKFDW
jgi:hypothetical protein